MKEETANMIYHNCTGLLNVSATQLMSATQLTRQTTQTSNGINIDLFYLIFLLQISTSVITAHVRMERHAPTLMEVISAHVPQASKENSVNKAGFCIDCCTVICLSIAVVLSTLYRIYSMCPK